jgi:molybdopterin synthase sulfur carrier subunit
MQVRIPGLLRSYTKGAETVALEPNGDESTLADALAELDARYPGFRFRIVDEQGAIRPHIKIFVDGELARDLATTTRSANELMIVGALSGG